MKSVKYSFFLIITTLIISCKINYSLGGIDTGDAKTFQVNFFQNNAPIPEAGLDNRFTNELQNIIKDQTPLELVTSNGDIIYEGEIIEYRISPTTATSDNRAAQNRLTIAVNVRYFNTLEEEKDFEQRFSFFFDFEGSSLLVDDQKSTAIDTILERLAQDIIKTSLDNWN